MFQVIATASHDYPIDMEAFRQALGAGFEARDCPLPYGPMTPTEEDDAARVLQPADGLLVRIGYLGPRLIASLPGLKVITLHGAGTDQVDVAAAAARGIVVTNTPGANAQAVAELAIGLMLAVLRRVPAADRRVRGGDWAGARVLGHELSGRTLGLLGLGNIGRRVAALGRAFGMTVLAYDPYQAAAPEGVTLVDLATLAGASDVLSLHVPQTPETVGIVSASFLAAMKPGAILVNTARGSLVDEAALAEALQNGRLAGAGLDVHAQEPPDPANPFLAMENVVVTPHIGSSTHGALRAIARTAGEDMARVLRGEPARCRVYR